MKKHVFMMPHPPIIIEEIGQEDCDQANCTITGMKILANRIAEIQPDTIVFVTPHGNSFSNGTCLLIEENLEGDFSKFGHPLIGFSKKVNTKLTRAINERLEEKDILSVMLDNQLASQYNVQAELDHGVMVPMYFIDKEYKDYNIVHITPGFTPINENFQIGTIIREAIEETMKNDKVVFLASGDLSHALSNSGPYAFHESGPKFDEIIQKSIIDKDPMALIDLDSDFVEEASQCGLRSIVMGFGFLDGFDLKSKVISYEGPFGVGYLTASLEEVQKNGFSYLDKIQSQVNEQYQLRVAKEDSYIKLARKAIEHFVETGLKVDYRQVDLPEEFLNKNLNRASGAFVSIHKNHKLRGCIGTIEATSEHIIDEIIYNGISACSKDPRFHPIDKDELAFLDIKVDLLYPKEKIESMDALDTKRYGVIIEQGYKRGLLLPNLDGIDTVEEQVAIAKEKAGIVYGQINMYRFEVERHEIHE